MAGHTGRTAGQHPGLTKGGNAVGEGGNERNEKGLMTLNEREK